MARRGGRAVTLGQIADIEDGQQEEETVALVNGERAISIDIIKSQGENTIDEDRFTGMAALRQKSLALTGLFMQLVRTRLHNLYFSGGLDNKTFQSHNKNSDTNDPKSYSNYESDSLRMGLSGNLFDDLGGGGANSASVQALRGRLTNMQAHNLLGAIEPDYNKLNYSLSRQQSLTANHSLYISLSGQHATQVLDTSEKLYIGGAQTVRAYPVSELGGERGQLVSGEWRWRLDPTWMLSAFVDYGRVVALPTSSAETTTATTLRGHGLSMGWQGPNGISAKLTWAYRDGHNPKPTPSGTDSDGTLKLDRFWFTTSMVF